MNADTTDETSLTERQVQVMRLREDERTQQEVAELLGTTASNVSAVERAAQDNIEKARRTLDLVRTIRAPVRLEAPRGMVFEDLVDAIYAKGDESGIKIDYCIPELYSHLYAHLQDSIEGSRLITDAEIGITRDGTVKIYTRSGT